MEARIILFNVAAFAASLYAATRGGMPERIAGVLLILAVLLTRMARAAAPALSLRGDLGVLGVDLLLLCALVVLALRADRYWPLWLAALQAVGTLAHTAWMIDPAVDRLASSILIRMWSYPMTGILVIATLRHRWRLAGGRPDFDWTPVSRS